MRSSLAVILAAGEGKRMKSRLPKVLHPIAGKPMLMHVVDAMAGAVDRVAVVVSPSTREAIEAALATSGAAVSVHVQAEQRGTAHAVLAAREAFGKADDIVVVFGDTPFVSPRTVKAIRARLAEGAAVVAGGMHTEKPTGYGRLIMRGDRVAAIREEKDASEAERALRFVNGGMMGLAGKSALALLDEIDDDNAQGEFYLTSAPEVAGQRDHEAVAVEVPEAEVFGINDRIQLAEAEARWQQRRRIEALEAGVMLAAPQTVFFTHDTRLARDVTVEPNVVFGPGVTIDEGATICAFSHIEGAHVAAGATVGPFARLRPGATIGAGAHIGNFVEIKAADVEAGAKVNHLSYIGDARVGAKSNIGAGTITCNYDGVNKHRTDIGAGAFIGSNSSLVAPVSIGDGAYVASGSVVTEDVPAGALAFGRARQVNKPGRAPKKAPK